MKQIVLYIFLAAAFHTVKAQHILLLPDVIGIALKNSLDVQLSKNAVEANDIFNNYGIAGGLPLVTGILTDNEQVSNINQKLNTGVLINRNGAATNNAVVGITGSILLYNGNRVHATKARLAKLFPLRPVPSRFCVRKISCLSWSSSIP